MWGRVHRWWSERSERAALSRRAIPDALWRRTLKRFPFLPAGTPEELALRRLTSLFLDRKEFTGAQGLVITDDMAVAIAAQACLPILNLGLEHYDRFVGIVVHPGQAVVRRSIQDDDGIVHEYDDVLSGEAVDDGPVMLSWRDVRAAGASAQRGYNVVIHEFAHVLDMGNGLADGIPALPTHMDPTRWIQALSAAHEALTQRVEAGESTAIDPYASDSIQEFYAVATEAFFVSPQDLAQECPVVFDLLGQFHGGPSAPAQRPTPAAPPGPWGIEPAVHTGAVSALGLSLRAG